MPGELNRIAGVQYGNAFARLYGLEDINAIGEVAPEVMPTTSIWERPEFWALTGGKLGAMRVTAAAPGAGNANYVTWENPSGSSLIVIIDQLVIATAILVKWGMRAAIPGNSTPHNRDTRQRVGTSTNTLGAKSASIVFAVGAGIAGVWGAMTGPAVIPINGILKPGDAFIIEGPDNVAVDVSVNLRERRASGSELSL